MFRKKRPARPAIEFHKETQKAVLKCSVCTGEQVAGFKDLKTGKFTEVMLIRDSSDLEEFLQTYGLTDIPKEY